jgi:hypothetical protein
MIVEILASDLPGLRCGPAPDGSFYENIHVRLARHIGTVDLDPGGCGLRALGVRADGSRSRRRGRHHRAVRVGQRGDRAFGLRWGVPADAGSFGVFRAAKLRFSDVDPAALREAIDTDSRLVGRSGSLTSTGGPGVPASGRPM